MAESSIPLESSAISSLAALRGTYVDLFLISFATLFLELACIRWFGSTVIFMTFFTNFVLMACFLGMTVGCLAASRKTDLMNTTIPLMLLVTTLACATLWGYNHFGRVMVDVGGQASPQQIYFGTEYRPKDPSYFVVPIEVLAGLFYALVGLVFVGLGQVMGRAFNAIPNRIAAYTINIIGSLIGIIVFGVAAYFRTTPFLWFAISLSICLYFVKRWTWLQIGALIATFIPIAWTAYGDPRTPERTFWSPYYKVLYSPRDRYITTNNIGHQGMLSMKERGSAYLLPHLLNRDAGNRPFENVLIIGAGSGNDVQAALSSTAKHIDAVEIDSVIYEIGQKDHPDQPYSDPRVTVHLDDGRSFLHKTDTTYDLIIYALVDSLVLHSGYSSLRLENFLFTEEAFQEIKAKLKPTGVFAMYNYYRQGWVIGRLEKMAEKVFGSKPTVLSLPYQEQIRPMGNQVGYYTILLVSNTDCARLDTIRKHLEDDGSFWLNENPSYNETINAFGRQPPAVTGTPQKNWQKIGTARVDTIGIDGLPSDDWPFLYLRDRRIPSLNIHGMVIVAILSLAILFVLAPVRTVRINWHMFFLGAGFMLLETKSVVHMALLFGSTWVVNSIVFFAILVMILLSNLFVWRIKPQTLWPYYGLLIAGLLANIYVPMSTFLTLPGEAKVIVSCAAVFMPIFFAGVIFATVFRDSRQPDVDFGSNIGGVILGGLSEYLSLVVGFNHLLVIGIAFYVLSMVFKPRLQLACPVTS